MNKSFLSVAKRFFCLILSTCFLTVLLCAQADGTISTFAGTGAYGYSNGGAATASQIDVSYDVAVDAQGNVYIADSWNHRIRRVTPAGTISVFAGTGTEGFSGDNGQAAAAALSYPRGLAIDSNGNVFVSDSGNGVIRKILTNGIIQTVAGNRAIGDQGDGGQALSASFRVPRGLAVDSSGNLYIADSLNARIRKMATDGRLSTIAGTGQFGNSGDGGQATSAAIGIPHSLAMGANGVLYFTDLSNHVIRRIRTDGIIEGVAGAGHAGFSGDNGFATLALLNLPKGLAVDSTGNVLFSDSGNNRIRQIKPNGVIATIAGTGEAGFRGDSGLAAAAVLNYPQGLAAIANGTVYIADVRNYRIRRIRQSCVYSFSPATLSLGMGASTSSITVSTYSGCSWSATSNATWLRVTGGGSGSASGTVSLAADANTAGGSRTAILAIAGQTVNVVQGSNIVISGTVRNSSGSGLAGVSIRFANGPTATTDTSGAYSVTLTSTYYGIATASLDGYVFGPVTRVYSGPSGNLSNEDYIGSVPSQPTLSSFVSLQPCRVLETRSIYALPWHVGVFGPPFFASGASRTLPIPSVCGVPSGASAYVFNVTLVPRGTGVGYATVSPTGEVRPSTWSIRSPDGQIVANTAVVKAGLSNSIDVFVSDSTDILIDISGYFTANPAVTGYVYYPLTPCRVVETRSAYRTTTGPFGPPSLTKGETRRFRFPSTPYCPIPTGAAAYSVTLTVVPPAPLAYLTAWPSFSPQPIVSNINSSAGRILANSAIVPANQDSIDLFVYDASDVIVDINGYFAPDNGAGLFYVPFNSCRIMDTTSPAYSGALGPPQFNDSTTRTLPVQNSIGCPSMTNPKAYVVTVTALPNGSPLPFLTLFPTGTQQPNASQLNAFEGQVVSNTAIVPAGTAGSLDLYAYRHTNVVLELSGYFTR